MPIRILPETVASQIAAGEVVERPSSVVKELVENALDAGATSISVALEAGGKRLIRVADNGVGIPTDEVALAFHRHATSKIATADDLTRIQTLGFRGEALASIAAVSQVTMVTRWEGEQAGTRTRIEGGHLVGQEAIGAPQGTIVTVEHLFYNVPARLKFLKSEITERRHAYALVTRYAMAYPCVRFTLEHGGQVAFRSGGNGSLRDVLTDVYGTESADYLLTITDSPAVDISRDDLPPIGVSGFVSAPSLHRAGRDQITLFVNGRWVQDARLVYAITQAYHTLLPTGRYPIAVVLATLPPEEVDVNVHPAKAEVRFRRADAVFDAVQRAVRRTLVDQAPVAPLGETVFWGSPEWEARRERLARTSRAHADQLGMELPETTPGQRPSQRPSGDAAPTLPMLRVVGQVGATYIVAEGPDGLYLIDQHAAHERVLYEQFMALRAEGEAPPSQTLLEPMVVELLPEEVALLEETLMQLLAVGFDIELFGRQAVLVRALPALVADVDPAEALRTALSAIDAGKGPTETPDEDLLVARVCKQAAIKAGQILSYEEMQSLVHQLEACTSPHTCPHGRPTMLHLTAEQLAKQFGRI